MTNDKIYPEPVVGQKIYVPSALYMSRGRDDFEGGIATIKSVSTDKDLPDNHVNKIFITIEERPNWSFNYKSLIDQQDELKEQFGEQIAHPDPDNRPEFNDDVSGWKKV